MGGGSAHGEGREEEDLRRQPVGCYTFEARVTDLQRGVLSYDVFESNGYCSRSGGLCLTR